MRIRALPLAAPLVLALAAACADTLPDQDLRIVDARPVERLSAALLWRDFRTQHEQAARTYNGRAVIVTGEVIRAGTDDDGAAYVLFGQDGDGGVHAGLLEEEAAGIIGRVQETSRISLKCFCQGFDGRYVVLKSCIAER